MKALVKARILAICGALLCAVLQVRAAGSQPGRSAAELPAPPVSSSVGVGSMWTAQEGGGSRHESAHEDLYKWINFFILLAGLGYVLRKPLRAFFSGRLEAIRNGLREGRQALEASEARLAAVEGKLRNLEREIEDFRASSAREMEAERERLKQAAEHETERILQFAQAQIEAAGRAARLDLKRYAAGAAAELAEALIRERLDEGGRQRLVSRFVGELKGSPAKN